MRDNSSMVQMVILKKRTTLSLPDEGYQRNAFDVRQFMHLITHKVSKEARQQGKSQRRKRSTLKEINEREMR